MRNQSPALAASLVASAGLCGLSLLRRRSLKVRQELPRDPLSTFHDAGHKVFTRDAPPNPEAIAEELKAYQNTRSASFYGWLGSRGILILTTFSNTSQVHLVQSAGGCRTQLTFLDTPVNAPKPIPGDENSFFFLMDTGGDEKWQIYRYSTVCHSAVLVTDGTSKNQHLTVSPCGSMFAFSSTLRNNKDWDIYVGNTAAAEQPSMVLKGERGSWAVLDWNSADTSKLLVRQYISSSTQLLFVLDTRDGSLTAIENRDGLQETAIQSALFSGDGSGIFFTSTNGSEFATLRHVAQYSEENHRHITTNSIPWDIEHICLSSNGNTMAFVANENAVSRIYYMDTATFAFLPVDLGNTPAGVISQLSFSPDGDVLGFALDSAKSPGNIYTASILPDPQVQQWTFSENQLNSETCVCPQSFSYGSFDGEEIPAFIYRPLTRAVPTGNKQPVVIYIHGGPASQFRPTFIPVNHAQSLQYLVAKGIAVIAPNVRGSRGYGKRYLAADDQLLRHNSVKDIGSLLDWIARDDDLDSQRVCVMGRSYGGFMVLASLVEYSHRLSCGIAVCAISHLVTFLENTAEWRRDLRRPEYGDERCPKTREYLNAISPLTNSDSIDTPLLLCQGANDSRVPLGETLQVANAVCSNGQPCWVMVAKDEGHIFKRKTTMDFNSHLIAHFVQRFLLAPITS